MFLPSSTFKILDQSHTSIFYEKPTTIQADEKALTKYAASQKIEILIKELTEKGPVIAGKIGPGCFETAPYKDDKFCGKKIFWPGSIQRDLAGHSPLLILGAKKIVDQEQKKVREYVYFTVFQGETESQISCNKHKKPFNIYNKIYVVSHESFRWFLFDLFPCRSSITAKQKYAHELSVIPLYTILDEGEQQAKCKAIGQKAFDEFKEKAKGNSRKGGEAVNKICNLIRSIAPDGGLRQQFIERAWKGIGDDTWRWHH